jgi:hypothetical protein
MLRVPGVLPNARAPATPDEPGVEPDDAALRFQLLPPAFPGLPTDRPAACPKGVRCTEAGVIWDANWPWLKLVRATVLVVRSENRSDWPVGFTGTAPCTRLADRNSVAPIRPIPADPRPKFVEFIAITPFGTRALR